MSVKMTGAEYVEFINSDWGGLYWDDMLFDWNGEETGCISPADVKPSDSITIIVGHMAAGVRNLDKSAESFFRDWRKRVSTVTFAVTVAKADEALLRETVAAIKSAKMA